MGGALVTRNKVHMNSSQHEFFILGIKPYMSDKRNCFAMCGPERDSGKCELFCGIGGYCCRNSRTDCPKEYGDVVTSGHYSCVKVSEQSKYSLLKYATI